MKIYITKKDIIWSYAGNIIPIAVNLLLLPVVMHLVSSDSLGIWYIFLSIGAIVNLFDFGFSPTLARNVAYCWSGVKSLKKNSVDLSKNEEVDFAYLKAVLKTSRTIYLIVAMFAMVIIVSIGTPYILHLTRDMDNGRYIIAWIIYCLAVFLNLFYCYYSSYLKGIGAIKQCNFAQVISKCANLVIAYVLLKADTDIIGLSLAYCFSGILFRYIAKKEFYKFMDIGKELHKVKEKVNLEKQFEIFKIIWPNAYKDGLVSVSNYLSNQAMVLIASNYLPLKAVAIYSISNQIVGVLITTCYTLYVAYQPMLQEAYVRNDKKTSFRLMSVAMSVYVTAYFVGMAGIVWVAIPLLKLINPSYNFDIAVIIFLSIYEFLFRHYNCYASYISNTNSVPYVKSYIITSLVGVVLSVTFVRYWGVWGLIGGPFFVQLLYNDWFWPRRVFNMLNTNFVQFYYSGYKNLILKVKEQLKDILLK